MALTRNPVEEERRGRAALEAERPRRRSAFMEYTLLACSILLLTSIPLSLFFFFKQNVEIQDNVNETLWQVYNLETELQKTLLLSHEAEHLGWDAASDVRALVATRFEIFVSRVNLLGAGDYGQAITVTFSDQDPNPIAEIKAITAALYDSYLGQGLSEAWVQEMIRQGDRLFPLVREVSTTLYNDTSWISRIHGKETEIVKIIIYASAAIGGLLAFAVFATLRSEGRMTERMLDLEKEGRIEAQRRAEADAKAHEMLLLLLEAERDARREALRRGIADRKAQQMLSEMEKARSLSILTGGVAHEFNNLLMVIHGNAELLKMAGEDPKLLERMTERVLTAAQQGASLSRQLLAYARQQELDVKTLPVVDLIDKAVEFARPAIKHAAQIVTDPVEHNLEVAVDLEQFKGVLLNLLLNAREAMDGNGVIRISTQPLQLSEEEALRREPALLPGDYVTVSVADNGSGMPEEVVKRAFDPFFTTKETGRGTGLGLSMVIGFVRQCGGDCWIDSVLGEGTTINLLLPSPEVYAQVRERQREVEEAAGRNDDLEEELASLQA
jgi:signal transduction histidine kinase